MKQKSLFRSYWLALACICLLVQWGCGRNHKIEMPQSFNNAIANIDVNSQRTADFLEQMSDDTLNMDEAKRMYYSLYYIYAHDKAGIGVISQDKTSQLVDFYSDYGVDSLYLFALYLHAGAFRDAQDIPMAVEWYMKAIDLGKRKLPGSRFLGRSFDQLAYCYNHVFLPKRALDVLKDAEHFVHGSYIARIYHRMAIIYSNMGETDSCRMYVMKSISASPEEKQGKIAADNMRYLVSQKDTFNVQKYKACLMGIDEDKEAPQYAVNFALDKALYYNAVQKLDSAAYYYKKVINYNVTPLAGQEASMQLCLLYHQQGNDAEAWKYVRLYQQLTDSVMRTTESQRVAQVENMYNYQLQQKQANEKLKETNIRLKWALGNIVGLLLLLVLGYVVAHKYKKKTTRNLELSRKEAETAKHQNESLNIELQSSRQENAQILKQNNELNQELESLRKEMQETEARNAELERMLELGRMKISQDANAYLEKLKDQLNSLDGETGSALWAEASQAVDRVYPQLKPNIQRYLQIQDLVYAKIVYFSCMGFGVTRIGVLTAILPQSVVKRKNRMMDNAQKLHPELKIENYSDLITLLRGKRKYK